jgi:hypothetical protein
VAKGGTSGDRIGVDTIQLRLVCAALIYLTIDQSTLPVIPGLVPSAQYCL